MTDTTTGLHPTIRQAVGIREIADELGVSTRTVESWIYRGIFPDHIAIVSGKPIWEWPTIKAWAEDTGRL